MKSLGALGSLLGLQAQFEGKEKITSPYRESGWVHACLKPIGQAVAQVPIEFWTSNPDLDTSTKKATKLPPDHPLCRAFSSPNPLMTQSQFWEACAIHRALDGVDVWLLLDEAGAPLAKSDGKATVNPFEDEKIPIPGFIVPYRGRSVSYRLSQAGWPQEYLITNWGNVQQPVLPRSVLVLRDYNPDDPIGGLSDVDAALSEIDLDWQAARYQRALLKNSGDPGGYVQVEGQLGQPEERALKNEVQQQWSIERAGEWRILTGKNLKYIPNTVKPRDMQYADLLKWCRDKIAGILGVPPPIIGVYENATLANFEQAIQLFWRGGNGVLARILSVQDSINGHLLPRIRKDRNTPETVYAKFNTAGVRALQENKALQFEIAQKLAAANIGLSIHEALKLVGVETEPLKYGDVRLVPSTLVPIERALAEPDPAADPAADQSATDGSGDPADDPDPEAPAEDDTAKAQPAARDAAPAEQPTEDEAFKERTAYWQERELAYASAGRAEVKRKYIRWRKRYEDSQLRRLRDFAKKGPDALRSVRRDTLDDILDPLNLHGSVLDPLLVDREQWAKSMRTALEAALRSIFEDALIDMAEELDSPVLSMEAPSITRLLETQVLQLTEGHTSVLAEKVREALLEGLSKATSTGTLQDLVLEVLPELEGNLKLAFADREGRALTIARTEVGHASSAARDMQMREGGVDETEWITSRDLAVRGAPGGPYEDAQYSHFELEGRTAPIGAEFDPSNHPGLTRPHAPTAQAGDSINCRCIARPVLKET